MTVDGLNGNELCPTHTTTEIRDTSLLQSAVGVLTGWLGLPLLHLSPVLRVRRPAQLTHELARTDVVVVEHPWQFPYVNELTPKSTPIVYSSHNVEPELVNGKTRFGRFVRRRVARLEAAVLRAADAAVVVSERDRQVYQDKYEIIPRTHLVPNGVPVESVSSGATVQGRLSRGLFVGSDHPPNVEAVDNICRIARADETPEDFVFDIVGTVCRRFD
ncbi:glycosyltransferase, partial [Haloplanus salinarum]